MEVGSLVQWAFGGCGFLQTLKYVSVVVLYHLVLIVYLLDDMLLLLHLLIPHLIIRVHMLVLLLDHYRLPLRVVLVLTNYCILVSLLE